MNDAVHGAGGVPPRPVTAFISWAHDDKVWERTIADFVVMLRRYGVAADVDLFHVHEPDINWANYGPNAIEDNEFVLVAASALYRERWEERADPTTGAGAVREARVLKSLFDGDRREFQRKVKVVVLPGSRVDAIPSELRSACPRFDVESIDLAGLEDLLRTLTGQPWLSMSPIGVVPILPPLRPEDADARMGTAQEQERGYRQRLDEVEQRQRSASSHGGAGQDSLESEKSTLQAALAVVSDPAAQAASGDLAPGTMVDRFRIERVIGHGGQGVVYAATQLSLHRKVALKLITAQSTKDPAWRERFQQEARIAASLNHPHILPVIDSGEREGDLYMVMKLVDAPDLSSRLRRDGALYPEQARAILGQIATAIDAAHAAGLIHRDVKPANVLLEPGASGVHAYLTDFGLARPLEDAKPYTEYGMVAGTRGYMAPEQLQDEKIDGRVDVYAFGCTLYECVTGKPPFRSPHEHLVAKIPLPSNSLPGIPRTFDAAVALAMAKDPEQRAGSAAEVMRVLDAPVRDPPPEPKSADVLQTPPTGESAPITREPDDAADRSETDTGEREPPWIAIGYVALCVAMLIGFYLIGRTL